MKKTQIEILDTINDFISALQNIWISSAANSIKDNNFFTAALSGGNTPQNIYKSLAKQIPIGIWNKTRLFQVDERYVDSQNIDSNQKMIEEALINKISHSRAEFYPINTDLSLDQSAQSYESIINQKVFHQKNLPCLDLILLGLGTDGHTASLFPNNKVLNEKNRLISGVITPENLHDRITMTYPLINNAKDIVFMITGGQKSEILHSLIKKIDNQYPASRILPVGTMTFLCDRESAVNLSD